LPVVLALFVLWELRHLASPTSRSNVARMAATAVDHEHRVTPRELFFDLVFVFAFTQVATLLADDPTFAGIGRGVLVYAYAHFPMIVGIVLFAFAMKTVIGHVGEDLNSVAAFALCGGSALYLLTYSAIRSRVERRLTLSRGRFVAALALVLLLPVATVVPAFAALALVTAVWLALHVYELVWWRDARAESRSLLSSP
jgi:low temperature requirement protein LtrA